MSITECSRLLCSRLRTAVKLTIGRISTKLQSSRHQSQLRPHLQTRLPRMRGTGPYGRSPSASLDVPQVAFGSTVSELPLFRVCDTFPDTPPQKGCLPSPDKYSSPGTEWDSRPPTGASWRRPRPLWRSTRIFS